MKVDGEARAACVRAMDVLLRDALVFPTNEDAHRCRAVLGANAPAMVSACWLLEFVAMMNRLVACSSFETASASSLQAFMGKGVWLQLESR